jgi:crotonobetainyl-CoA:carnitine CoA-transferase CaiB-like acyl-CoA transferase
MAAQWRRLCAIMETPPISSDRGSARHFSVESVSAELDELLLRRVQLRDDIARMQKLLKDLAIRTHSRLTRLEQATHLERACRIALMETNEAVSVAMVYNRIVKRGSIAFAGHKRPHRAIEKALNRLVELGEADLVNEARNRRWSWVAGRASL